MFGKKSNGAIIATLLLTVFIWGGSNAGTKYLVGFCPPGLIGGTRLLCAGLILLAILKWTKWLGTLTPLTASTRQRIMAARVAEPGDLHRGVQLGDAFYGGIACGVISGHSAGVGVALGRPAGANVAFRAALRRGGAGGDRRGGFILAFA